MLNEILFNIKAVFLLRLLRIVLAVLVAMPSPLYAQGVSAVLPPAGTMVGLTGAFVPVVLKGIKVSSENAFQFDFLVDAGGSGLSGQPLKEEADKLIRYFLASMTLPEKELWVNLSPYEKDRIIPEAFGLTAMGRDVLAQDYLLKQVTSSLMHPDQEPGRSFWAKVYAQAFEQFGTTDVPVDTFNKVWIVPDRAVVSEEGARAVVAEAHFKVMLEADYLADEEGKAAQSKAQGDSGSPELARSSLREIIIPLLEKEVNQGKNFAPLRQVYYSLILATWYKKRFYESILSRVYADKEKVVGVGHDEEGMVRRIYEQYLDAFRKGSFDLIREEVDRNTQELLPRKYFSGGCTLTVPLDVQSAMKVENTGPLTVYKATLWERSLKGVKKWTPEEESFLDVVTRAWGVAQKYAGRVSPDFVRAVGADGYGVYDGGVLDGAPQKGFIVFGQYIDFKRALEAWIESHPDLSSRKNRVLTTISSYGHKLLENVSQHAQESVAAVVVSFDRDDGELRIASADVGPKGFPQAETGRLNVTIKDDGKFVQDQDSRGRGDAMRLLTQEAKAFGVISHGLQVRAENGARGEIPSLPYDGPHQEEVARLPGTTVFLEYDFSAELAQKSWSPEQVDFLDIVTRVWGAVHKASSTHEARKVFAAAGIPDGYGVYDGRGRLQGRREKGFIVFGEDLDFQAAFKEWVKGREYGPGFRRDLSFKGEMLLENIQQHADGRPGGIVFYYDEAQDIFRIAAVDSGKSGFHKDADGLRVIIKRDGRFVQRRGSPGKGKALGFLHDAEGESSFAIISQGLQVLGTHRSRGRLSSADYNGPRASLVKSLPGTAVFWEYQRASELAMKSSSSEEARQIPVDVHVLDKMFPFLSISAGTGDSFVPVLSPQDFLRLVSALAGRPVLRDDHIVGFSSGRLGGMEIFPVNSALIVRFLLRGPQGDLQSGPEVTWFNVNHPDKMRMAVTREDRLPGWEGGRDPKRFLPVFFNFLKSEYEAHLGDMERGLGDDLREISGKTSFELVENFHEKISENPVNDEGGSVDVYALREDPDLLAKRVLVDFPTREAALNYVYNSVLPDYKNDLEYYSDVILPYERIVVSQEDADFRVYFIQRRLELVPKDITEDDPRLRAIAVMAQKFLLGFNRQTRERGTVRSILEIKGQLLRFKNSGIDPRTGEARLFDLGHASLDRNPNYFRASFSAARDLASKAFLVPDDLGKTGAASFELAQSLDVDPNILEKVLEIVREAEIKAGVLGADPSKMSVYAVLSMLSAILGTSDIDGTRKAAFSYGPIAEITYQHQERDNIFVTFRLRDERGVEFPGPNVLFHEVASLRVTKVFAENESSLPGWQGGGNAEEFISFLGHFLKEAYREHLEYLREDLPIRASAIEQWTDVDVVKDYRKTAQLSQMLHWGGSSMVFLVGADEGLVAKRFWSEFQSQEAALAFVYNSILPDYMHDLEFHRDVILPYQKILVSYEEDVFRVYLIQERSSDISSDVAEDDPVYRAFQETVRQYVEGFRKAQKEGPVSSLLEIKGRQGGFSNTGYHAKTGKVLIRDLGHLSYGVEEEEGYLETALGVIEDISGEELQLQPKRTFVPRWKALSTQEAVHNGRAASQDQQVATPGGVDLDPSRIQLDIQGRSALGVMSDQDVGVLGRKILGLVPVIVGASSVGSIQEFLQG